MVDRIRFANSFLLAAIGAVLTTPALAQVNITGDAQPAPTGFGVIFVDNDPNGGDGFSDVISTEGNFNLPDLADPFDVTGSSGNGLAWDDPLIWNNYESQQNILIGETGSGEVSIGGGSNLRFQHVVLGGVGEGIGSTGYETQVGAGNEQFTLIQAVAASANETAAGFGVMTVTGFGSLYSNDPQVYGASDLSALFFADAGSTAMPFDPMGFEPESPDNGAREEDEGFDFYVGLSGGGELNVTAGGRVEIQDALIVGLGETATGTVNVDGSGSVLQVSGRTERDFNNFNSIAGIESGAIIGGNGQGTLNVINAGRANFANGLSIGAGNGGVGTIAESGSGTVIVSGAGSTVAAFASNVIEAVDGTNLGLAVGELRDATSDTLDELGAGVLEIGDGALVNVTFDTSYARAADDANAEIGRNGAVDMRGGELRVGNDLTNDGDINGYGLVRANQLLNTTLSTLRGETGPTGERLRIIVDNDELDPSSDDFAFSNLGSITGEVDITVNGGFDNGDSAGASNGGVVRASGRIESGTFFNRPDAEVFVDSGETLEIRAVGNVSGADTGLLLGNGAGNAAVIGDPVVTSPAFSQANLGTISVDGGTLEVGRLVTTGAGGLAGVDDQFRNARDPALDALGQITSDDGEIVFHTGLLNTGVVSFTGGDSLVVGEVINSNEIDYDADLGVTTPGIPGVILVSGDNSTVTFADNVANAGFISVGPQNTVANFLGDLDNTGGTLEISGSFFGDFPNSAAIVVSNDVIINGGGVIVPFLTAGGTPPAAGIPLLTFGGDLIVEATPALLVEGLGAGQVAGFSVTDGQLNLVIVDSVADAFVYGDANGDGFVNAADYTAWRDSAGASVVAGTAGDFNSDGVVNGLDLSTWRLNYGLDLSASTPVPIPEPGPAALALLATATTVAGRRRRRR